MSVAEHPSHVIKKRTMVKDRVGCCRTSTYALPTEGHTYGMKMPEQLEGAGNIISNWVTANPSLEKKTTKLIVASNVLAIKHGCITASAMHKYGIEHPNIRMKEALRNDSTRIDANHEGPFGIKTKFAEEPMDTILQGKYTNFDNEDRDYPSVHSIKKVGYMPKPRPTIASTSQVLARQTKEEKNKPKHFIMKKFQNVKGKMQFDREQLMRNNNTITISGDNNDDDPATYNFQEHDQRL